MSILQHLPNLGFLKNMYVNLMKKAFYHGGHLLLLGCSVSFRTILPFPQYGHILGSMPVIRKRRSSQLSFSSPHSPSPEQSPGSATCSELPALDRAKAYPFCFDCSGCHSAGFSWNRPAIHEKGKGVCCWLLVDILLYPFNADLKFGLAGHSLFIISITCSYVVSERNSQQQTWPPS